MVVEHTKPGVSRIASRQHNAENRREIQRDAGDEPRLVRRLASFSSSLAEASLGAGESALVSEDAGLPVTCDLDVGSDLLHQLSYLIPTEEHLGAEACSTKLLWRTASENVPFLGTIYAVGYQRISITSQSEIAISSFKPPATRQIRGFWTKQNELLVDLSTANRSAGA